MSIMHEANIIVCERMLIFIVFFVFLHIYLIKSPNKVSITPLLVFDFCEPSSTTENRRWVYHGSSENVCKWESYQV